jgi:hypothetical protein
VVSGETKDHLAGGFPIREDVEDGCGRRPRFVIAALGLESRDDLPRFHRRSRSWITLASPKSLTPGAPREATHTS